MNGWKKRIPEKNPIWSRRIPERRFRGDGEEPLPDYLEGLNAEQKEAVLSTEGPLLVLAGAGTGKTRVLTTRLAHLLQTHKAYPSQILAVTFTNKAAREMRERIESMLDGPADGLWLGTFHSICARMLRQNCEYVNLERNFTILDTDDQIRLLKQLMAGAGVDKNHFPPKQVLHQIQKWKDRGLDPFDIKSGEGGSVPNRQWVHLYELYQKRLIELNACDFGDLMLHMVKIFCRHPEVLGRYQNRFRYIMVDEYQDTNAIQYRWLRQLAGGNARPNLACVGDDDQSIYSWRGAEVENILRFQKDFPGTHLVRLEKNYRSTPAILGAASGVIAHNDSRLGKTLYASDPDLQGELVQLARIHDSEEEASCVAVEIFLQNQRDAIPFRNMAVLVRAGFQMRAFETAFTEAQIPYRIVGGPKFYERMEIRDALAYMRAFSSDRDDLALERIINLPRRGMGTTGLVKLRDRAAQSGLSLQQQLREDLRERRLKGKAGPALKKLVENFDAALERMESMGHVQAVEMLLEETGYQQMWLEDTSTEAPGRLENLQELLHYLASFEDLSSFLEHIALVMDADSGNAQADSVNLMTIHAAKGLEFNSVFLPGWEEGVFPSWRSLDAGNAGLEEERRLAYVAITRARKKIMILQATRRCINGNWQDSIPSRFIEEIPEAFIDRPEEPAGRRTLPSFSRTPAFSRKRLDADADRRPGIKVGAQVSHSRFGVGIIVEMEGNRLRIKFEDGQERHLLSDYVTVSN